MVNRPDGNETQEATNDASQAPEYYSALSRDLHDLKNLLWPLSVQAECAPTECASVELVMRMNRFHADVKKALEVATRMSELVQRQSQNCGTQGSERIPAPRPTPPAPASRLRILCVVNDPSVRAALVHLLVHLGHDADSSCSGEEALQAFAAHTYEVVVTDIHLADMSGRDLTRNLRANGPVPVLWMTGADDVSQESASHQVDSPNCILAKPLSLIALRRALDGIPTSASNTAT